MHERVKVPSLVDPELIENVVQGVHMTKRIHIYTGPRKLCSWGLEKQWAWRNPANARLLKLPHGLVLLAVATRTVDLSGSSSEGKKKKKNYA